MSELLLIVPLLLACGVLAGLLSGLLGVGGGIVIVPMLYHVYTGLNIPLEVAMPLSVGTSLATIIFTSVVSARSHHRRGSVDWALVREWMLFLLIGVAVGIAVAGFVSATVLKSSFGILLIVVSAHMLITAHHSPRLTDHLPSRPIQSLLGVTVGGLSTLLGIGGGTVAVPLLNLFSFPMHRAVATATVFGLAISLPATFGYIASGWEREGLPLASTGYVNWLAFVLLVPLSMLFAPIGVRLCHRMNVKQLKQVFAVFLMLVGIKMVLA